MKTVIVPNLITKSNDEVSVDLLEFRVSVYGILIQNNRLLVHINPIIAMDKYCIPGGQIEKGESIQESLSREFIEETGLHVKPTKLRTVKEDFISFGDGKFYQTILIFYDVEQVGGELGKITNLQDSIQAIFVPLSAETTTKFMDVFSDLF